MRKAMISSAAAALYFLILSVAAVSQDVPAREVKGQVIRSTERLAAVLEFSKDFKYAGSQKFILYNVANAEQHFFVDADSNGRINRLYWVQFEGYLPSNNHRYDYNSPKTVNIGGFDFFADATSWKATSTELKPDSDGAHARAFLAGKGYTFSGSDFITQRLVHLTDERKRDELMIIYLEDMAPLGVTAADVGKGGKAEAKWPEIADALLVRAQKEMRVSKKK